MIQEAAPPTTALIVVPRVQVQNANCISSPLTWGFPSITAFTGLMTALERRLAGDYNIRFLAVGVVCHSFEAQVVGSAYPRTFRLTRNPVKSSGDTAAIVEEGRAHICVTLVFEVLLSGEMLVPSVREQLAVAVSELLHVMRVAGGSVLGIGTSGGRLGDGITVMPRLRDSDPESIRSAERRVLYKLLPGFVLVSRQDLFRSRALRSGAHLTDVFLELSGLTVRSIAKDSQAGEAPKAEWVLDSKPGWLVPIPIGYTSISRLFAPGHVQHARDAAVPFRFVECVWSIGEWISPHRLDGIDSMMWFPEVMEDATTGNATYVCTNRFEASEHGR